MGRCVNKKHWDESSSILWLMRMVDFCNILKKFSEMPNIQQHHSTMKWEKDLFVKTWITISFKDELEAFGWHFTEVENLIKLPTLWMCWKDLDILNLRNSQLFWCGGKFSAHDVVMLFMERWKLWEEWTKREHIKFWNSDNEKKWNNYYHI